MFIIEIVVKRCFPIDLDKGVENYTVFNTLRKPQNGIALDCTDFRQTSQLFNPFLQTLISIIDLGHFIQFLQIPSSCEILFIYLYCICLRSPNRFLVFFRSQDSEGHSKSFSLQESCIRNHVKLVESISPWRMKERLLSKSFNLCKQNLFPLVLETGPGSHKNFCDHRRGFLLITLPCRPCLFTAPWTCTTTLLTDTPSFCCFFVFKAFKV